MAGPHGIFPSRAAVKRRHDELMKPVGPQSLDMLMGLGMLFGPLIVGMVVPLGIAFVRRQLGLEIVFACGGLIVGGYMTLFAAMAGGFSSRAGAEARQLEQVPEGPVTERAEGELALVRGKVSALEGTIESELTGRPWLWSDITISTYALGNRGRVLEDFRTRSRSVPFVVDDGGSRVVVEPSEGILREAPHNVQARLDGPGSPRVRQLLEKEGLEPPSQGAEVEERAVGVGDTVTVIGVVRHGAGYRGAGARLASGPDDALCVTTSTRQELMVDWRGTSERTQAALGALLLLVGIASTAVMLVR